MVLDRISVRPHNRFNSLYLPLLSCEILVDHSIPKISTIKFIIVKCPMWGFRQFNCQLQGIEGNDTKIYQNVNQNFEIKIYSCIGIWGCNKLVFVSLTKNFSNFRNFKNWFNEMNKC